MSLNAHAIVTGGGSGIGLAIARALADAGHRVTIMGRNAERLEAARGQLGAATAIACDVADEAGVTRAFSEAAQAQGPVEILVNCAGIAKTAPFEKSDDALWIELWRTNVLGGVHACRAVLPGMRQRAAGRIVNIASTASLKGYRYASAYTATKHALLGLTRALALELADTPITVNAVCPGYVDTQMVRDAVANVVARTARSESEVLASFTQANPQGRLIQPEEISAAVNWLISEAAGSVTGQAIVIGGGEIM